ncbi:TonB-dependent receptor, partial [Acinetobacter nosocomialis]
NGNVVPSYDGADYAGNAKLEGKTWAVFIEDTLDLSDKFKLTLGNRYDHDEKFGDHNSPRAYLVYLPSEDWAIKGGVASGFRAPTIKESTAGAATQSG